VNKYAIVSGYFVNCPSKQIKVNTNINSKKMERTTGKIPRNGQAFKLKNAPVRNSLAGFFTLLIFFAFASCSQPEPNWLKGNLHTHTFWSDGDEFPESVAAWYKENGYDFLAITDHNVILEGERWRNFPENHATLHKCVKTKNSGKTKSLGSTTDPKSIKPKSYV
jgi:hypothetical protein